MKTAAPNSVSESPAVERDPALARAGPPTTFWRYIRTERWLWIVLAGAFVFHVVFIWRTSFTIDGRRYFVLMDDAMISMRYAQNLAHGHGLLWNAGQPPVEGITNPAWTLWMAAVHLLPLPARLMSLPIMLTSSVLVLATIVNVARTAALLSSSRIAAASAAVLCASFYPYTYWSLRGMEVGLVGFLTVTGLFLVLRDPSFDERSTRRGVVFVVALLIATRMDATVPALVLAVSACWLARPARRRAVAMWGIGAVVVIVAVETIARLAYYGSILPNTYYLKVSHIPVDVRLDRGLPLLAADAVSNFGPYLLLAAVGIAFGVIRRDRRIAVLVVLVATAALYSVWTGGDAFEERGFANRFLSTAAPVLMVLAGLGVSEVVAAYRRRALGPLVAFGASLALVLWWMGAGGPRAPVTARSVAPTDAGWLQALAAVVLVATVVIAVLAAGHGTRISTRSRAVAAVVVVVLAAVAANQIQYREWADSDAAAFEKQLTRDALRFRRATTPDAVIAYGAAGTAYFAGRRGVDLLGLSDEHIARQAPSNPVFRPGHNKFDYEYSLGELQPDLVAAVLPVPQVAGYRFTGYSFELVRVGTPRVNLDLVTKPVR